LAYVHGGDATLRSRNGNDLTERFRAIARAIQHSLRTNDCVLDGEVVALDGEGRPSFSAMQQGGPEAPLRYEVFDLLELEGEQLLELPLTERRRRLEAILDPRAGSVRLSEAFEDGQALLEAVTEQRLEGVIAKRAGSRYCEGKRTRDWLKIKARPSQEFIVAGYTKGQGRRSGGFGSLVLAVRRGGALEYVGNVGTGFTSAEIGRLLERLRPLRRTTPPFAVVPKMPRVRKQDVQWVEPELVVQVEFSEWTHDGHLRAPSYQGLREDKPASAVRRELPIEDVI